MNPINYFSDEQKTIEVIKKALPAVVSISVSQKLDKISEINPQFVFPLFEKDKKRTDALSKKINGTKLDISGGSGFIVDPSGIIVTNIHVVSGKDFLYNILFQNGKTLLARLLSADTINDVAFLKIESNKSFSFLKLGDSTKATLGQNVITIGNALGIFRNTISKGIISGLSRSIDAENEIVSESLRGLIQTDAAINPGNSGGPLLNMRCEVIGINSANVAHAENIGFAVPINIIKNDLHKLKEYGEIKRPFLGIRYIIINHQIQDLLNVSVSDGAYVISQSPTQEAVIKNSPAFNCGIKEKDILTEINNKKLSQSYTLQDFLEESEIGQKIKIKIIRKGKEIKVETVLAEN